MSNEPEQPAPAAGKTEVGVFEEIVDTSAFAANEAENDVFVDEDDKPEFSAEKLANWCTLTLDDDQVGKSRVLSAPNRPTKMLSLEALFALEHRQRLYYFLWWITVIGWNIPIHYFLFRPSSPEPDKLIVLAFNLLMTLLVRNEQVVWLLYIIGTLWAKCLPAHGFLAPVKKFANKMTINIGGIHTGSCFFLLLDWCWVIGEGIKNGIGGTPRMTAHFFIVVMSLIILLFIIILALPIWRHLQVQHDMFELSHRYGGWSIAALVLIDVLISLGRRGDEVFMVNDASTWMIIGSVFLIAWPWITFRPRVSATVFAPSDMVCIMSWKGKPWYFAAGTAGKVATNPFGQYHPFALLPDIGGDKTLACMAIAKAGDWTSSLIKEALTNVKKHGKLVEGSNGRRSSIEVDANIATTKIAVHRFARPGFMYLVRTYKRVICIGTGAGIAPISAYLPNPPNEMLILWFGRKFAQTYGPLYNFVAGYKHSILVDTRVAPSEQNPYLPSYDLTFSQTSQRRVVKKRRTTIRFGEKRPDVPKLAIAAVEMFNADAVFIVAGPGPSYNTCHELWKVGVHAYSATWDS